MLIFVAVLTTFLTQCVDYDKIPHSKKMSQVIVPKCTTKISGMTNVAIWLFTLYVIYQAYGLIAEIPRLMVIRNFYIHLLEVPDSDMQTISWQDIVARIMALRDANPMTAEKLTPAARKFMGSQSKERLDAHDIANRLMRKENYLIAMINKEILDLSVPLPFFHGRQLFSRTVQWTIEYGILDFLFNRNGHIRQLVLKDSHRRQLSQELRNRFIFAGFMNVLCAPVIVVYLVLVYFLKYFNVSWPRISYLIPHSTYTLSRNIKRIRQQSDRGNILRLLSGNFGNSTSLATCSIRESTCRTRLLSDILISSLKLRQCSWRDSCLLLLAL